MRRPRGAVNLVNLTLIVLVLAGAYLAWLYVPLWLDDLDVREAVAAAVGQLTIESSTLDGQIRQRLATQLGSVGTHWEDQDGKRVEVPGLGIEADDVQIERSPEAKTGRVTVDYARTVRLKPLQRYWTIRFHTSREGVLKL